MSGLTQNCPSFAMLPCAVLNFVLLSSTRLLHNLLRSPNTALLAARNPHVLYVHAGSYAPGALSLNCSLQLCNYLAKEAVQCKRGIMICSAVLVPWQDTTQIVLSKIQRPLGKGNKTLSSTPSSIRTDTAPNSCRRAMTA